MINILSRAHGDSRECASHLLSIEGRQLPNDDVKYPFVQRHMQGTVSPSQLARIKYSTHYSLGFMNQIRSIAKP